MTNLRIYVITLLVIHLISFSVYVQAQDQKKSTDQSLSRKAFNKGLRLISTNPNDTIRNEESTTDYAQYGGKVIRKITFEHIGFEISIYDSTKKVMEVITRAANAIHTDTREKIIKQHLFLEKNTPLNPNKLADNERFLRDKDFILDSRIIVTEVKGTDSVDLIVVTRDVFSLGARVGGSFPNAPQLGVYDANVGGLGQRIEFNTVLDQDRTPKFGYSLLYRKSSIFGSLANVEVGFTQMNSGLSRGEESEAAVLMRINRPLVSPYSRLAGGFEISRNWSQNLYSKPDTSFFRYTYKVIDTWIGYNLGIKKKVNNRNRHFLAWRALDYVYTQTPDQEKLANNILYNNYSAILASFTFYRQDFFKTRYIFGFGRTEDLPSGLSMELTSGYVRQLNSDRFYNSFNTNYSLVHRKGGFQSVYFQAGGYYNQAKASDVILDVGTTYSTKLIRLNDYKMRTSISSTYTKLFNHELIDYITLGNNQIQGFVSDSLKTDSRLSLRLESVLFTPWSFAGFRFAPFAGIDFASVRCVSCDQINKTFWGLSSGLRTRNENLIFGTIEVKMTYIPKDEFGSNKFVFGFKQNLRVKSTGTFVRAPSLIVYN